MIAPSPNSVKLAWLIIAHGATILHVRRILQTRSATVLKVALPASGLANDLERCAAKTLNPRHPSTPPYRNLEFQGDPNTPFVTIRAAYNRIRSRPAGQSLPPQALAHERPASYNRPVSNL